MRFKAPISSPKLAYWTRVLTKLRFKAPISSPKLAYWTRGVNKVEVQGSNLKP